MFTCDRLKHLFEASETRGAPFADRQRWGEEAYEYMQAFVDYVPQDLDQAMQSFELASIELLLDVQSVWKLARDKGRTTEGLIALRRMEREALLLPDGSVPPTHYEIRILRSLIAWMSRLVLCTRHTKV